jgi:hypothetical protein
MATSAKRQSQRRTRQTVPTRPPQGAASPHLTHDEIAARAYELFVRRGGGHGLDREDWLLAERELALNDSRQPLSEEQSDYAG